MRVAIVSLVLLASAAAAASADTIRLKDGRIFQGSMRREGDNTIIDVIDLKTGASLSSVTTTPDQVQSVTLAPLPTQAAEAEWKRAAEQIRRADTLADVLQLHRAFLDRFPDAPISGAVKTSLEEYRKLDQQNPVNFRGKWMPAAQVDTLLRNWKEQARPALDLYRAGKIREALELSRKLAAATPENPSVLAVAGLAAFRLNDLAASRQWFEKLAAADPSSPLAENNLAVIAAGQKNLADPLIHYARALRAAPANRLLLDNIQEALAGYRSGGGDENAPGFRNLLPAFEQAELRMQTEMAKTNLYRFASTWVAFDQFLALTNAHLNAPDSPILTGAQRLMEIGDDLNPPPPAPLALPARRIATAPPPPPPPPPPPQANVVQNTTVETSNTYVQNNPPPTYVDNTPCEPPITTTGNIITIIRPEPCPPPAPPPVQPPPPPPLSPSHPSGPDRPL